ncbi:hypothetical protein [Streptomyces violascens]|uniref:hypothetical protein n=1 Tax=Streptomyces violascens TaxID=67381 RepID=UPI00368ED978
MDQGIAAVLAAVIALFGVAVGLIGAHWQARGARAQAEATISAALKQADSALETVRIQAKQQNDQWRRTVSREAWVTFLRSLDDFLDLADSAQMTEFGQHSNSDGICHALEESFKVAKRRFNETELESPGEIASTARELISCIHSINLSAATQVSFRGGMEGLFEALQSTSEPIRNTASRVSDAIERLTQGVAPEALSMEVFNQLGSIPTVAPLQRVALTNPRKYNDLLASHHATRQDFLDKRSEFVRIAREHLENA